MAGAFDWQWRRIPSWISLGLIGLYSVGWIARSWGEGTPQPVWLNLASCAVVFVVAFTLYHFRIWGGGDTKLASAAALFCPITELARFVLVMALTGGFLAVIVLLKSRPRPSAVALTVPYGAAIAAAGLEFAVHQIARF